ACRLVFVNGRFTPELSALGSLPKGVTVKSLAEVLDRQPQLVEPHLAKYARGDEHPFVALNTAFIRDGAFVHLARGTVLREPIQLVYVATGRERPTVNHPRGLVLCDDNSQATLVQNYVGAGE